ncbi:MAG TPA: ABC transporter substrate-binding protein [Candidatus Binatia bacterium]|nr:ABC transporter substrate-binding protein [Candidatus Binatia bacterium]
MKFRVAAVDLISNTCFPALAADELGYFKAEGLEASIELFPMLNATKALHDGNADAMIAGSVHDVLTEFPNWDGVKIIVALSQGTPWLLTVRSDLPCKRGDLNSVRGLRLTAAQGPDLALKRMLQIAGIDPARDVEIVELPNAKSRNVSFGVFAAQALQSGQIDGFWANAMGAETAVNHGVGKVLIDVRRGDDPDGVRFFTFAGVATTDDFIQREPKTIAAAVRAIVKAQTALRAEPSLAREVGARKFPADAAQLIANVVARDVEFYDPVITEGAIAKMNAFAQSVGHLSQPVTYERVVAVQYRSLWQDPTSGQSGI